MANRRFRSVIVCNSVKFDLLFYFLLKKISLPKGEIYEWKQFY